MNNLLITCQLNVHNSLLCYTVVSEIFAGYNFREFHDKGRVRENLFAKFHMGGYKMAAFVKTDFR